MDIVARDLAVGAIKMKHKRPIKCMSFLNHFHLDIVSKLMFSGGRMPQSKVVIRATAQEIGNVRWIRE
jgi:hypothetical protein